LLDDGTVAGFVVGLDGRVVGRRHHAGSHAVAGRPSGGLSGVHVAHGSVVVVRRVHSVGVGHVRIGVIGVAVWVGRVRRHTHRVHPAAAVLGGSLLWFGCFLVRGAREGRWGGLAGVGRLVGLRGRVVGVVGGVFEIVRVGRLGFRFVGGGEIVVVGVGRVGDGGRVEGGEGRRVAAVAEAGVVLLQGLVVHLVSHEI